MMKLIADENGILREWECGICKYKGNRFINLGNNIMACGNCGTVHLTPSKLAQLQEEGNFEAKEVPTDG